MLTANIYISSWEQFYVYVSYDYPEYPVRNYYYSHFTDEEISIRELGG